ncbi:hypothetical protein PYW07_011885 [Mythimna separata]|uniref:Uncharacterized protein n=1 Tax=Mythimna separata TaxID=271217 RepID=A0AAD7Y7D3_MYTSE|nr:hypothetical protein PYW07_011885 [Mythimna separata]
MPCVCATKSQDQAYYNKRIDEEISEWLKNVPVHSLEQSESRIKREAIIKQLRNTLKQLPDDENFEDNATNEIQSFVENFPLWNPGKDESDEKLFKDQLADMLAEKIKALPRKTDRFRYIVKKWVANMDFEDSGEEIDLETIVDNFVNKLKSLAADRPTCDVKYTNLLRKEIIDLLVELALKFDGDMLKLKRMASVLATEIASLPRNVNLGETTKLASAFEESIADWICEQGLCGELKRNPKLIEGLTKRLHQLKSQGVLDEDVREEVKQFMGDVSLAFETIDELTEELMKHLSSSIQMIETEKLDTEEINDEISNWVDSLPGVSNLDQPQLEKIRYEIAKAIEENREQENENLANDIINYLMNTGLSIDPADLGLYVEELLKNLSTQLSDRNRKEQAKILMVKDIFEIIDCSPIPEEKKEQMKSRANEIVDKYIRQRSINLKLDPYSVKETLIHDIHDVVNDIELPIESRLQLKSLLSASISRNFDKTFTGLIRDQSDLKQSILNEVTNAIEELPIDPDRKKDLMLKVKETLLKHTNKPLPNNIKSNVNDEICDVVERCPTCEDRNILGYIKKVFSEAVSKHLTPYLPKCVCDVQIEIEDNVSTVIDRSSISTGKKRDLKESIQKILKENEGRCLSDEVIRTIKENINNVISDLLIPQDKKDILKKAVGETVSHDFKDAGEAFSHDLNKIRDKLLADITNVIEKSPIKRDVKSHLMDKLDTVLARNLDPSLSDEKKHMILNDISEIITDDMPEEKRRNLINKLAEKLGIHQRKEETDKLTEIINRLSIDSIVKDDIKSEIKAMLLETLYNALSVHVQQQILEDVLNAIDEMNIQEHEKQKLKSNVTQAIAKELDKLISQDKEVPEVIDALEKILKNEIKNAPIAKDDQELLLKKLHDVLTENLVPAVTDEVVETIRERLDVIVDDYITDEDKADVIKAQLRKVDSNSLVKSAQTISRIESKESLCEKKQRTDLTDLVNETLNNILLDMEQVVDKAPISREEKIVLKNKLKNIAIKNFNKPLHDVANGLTDEINVILDDFDFPNDKKNKLNRELTAAVDKNMNDLQELTKYVDTEYSDSQKKINADGKTKRFGRERMLIEEFGGTKVKDRKNQGIENIIEESGVPEEENRVLKRGFKTIAADLEPTESFDASRVTDSVLLGIDKITGNSSVPQEIKTDLKRKLKHVASENLKKPFSDNVEDKIKIDTAKIIDDLPMPRTERNKLKSSLTKMVHDNVDLKRPTQKLSIQEDRFIKVNDKLLHDIFQETERAIDETPLPREKKNELKKKLKQLANKDFNKIPLENVQEELIDGMIKIIDELNLPKDRKSRLKNKLTTATDGYVSNMETTAKDKYTESSELKERPSVDSRYKKNYKNLQPKVSVAATKVEDTILQEIDKITENSNIPKEIKTELKRKLKNMSSENLKKPFSKNVEDKIKIDAAKIIDDLPMPRTERNKLKGEFTNMVSDNVGTLRGAKQKFATQEDRFIKVDDKPLHDIFQELERAIEEAPLPREKKNELKKKLKRLTTRDFNKIPLENVQDDMIIDDMIIIIDKMNLPKDKKNKLKTALTTAVDEYKNNMQIDQRRRLSSQKPKEVVDAAKVRDSILQEIDKIIEDSTVPKEKNMELKRKMKSISNEHKKKPFSKDMQDTMKHGIAEIMDQLPISKTEKNKMKTALTINLDENIPQKMPIQGYDSNEFEKKPLHNIFEYLKRAIEGAPISTEKKVELKKKLQDLATKDFNNKTLEDLAEAVKVGSIEIVDELNLPADKKNNLKNEVLHMADENIIILQEQGTSEMRRRDAVPPNIKESVELATGNINYSLKELIDTNRNVRKQWSRHLDNVMSKLPLLRKDNNDLKNKLAIYDETGQINILSNLNRHKEKTEPAEDHNQVTPKPTLKNNKGKPPPKIEEAFTFNNTTKQKSPFSPNSKKAADEKDPTINLKETINTWLKKQQIELEPNEKNRILEELSKDITDRKKYLQTFGINPECDDLDYLKLQVHRRLNGLVPIEVLKKLIENTKELLTSIDKALSPTATKTKNDQQKRNFQKPTTTNPAQRKLGPADILGIHGKATNTTTPEGVPHTVDNDDGVEDNSDTEVRPGQTPTPAKDGMEDNSDTEFRPGQTSTPVKPTQTSTTVKPTQTSSPVKLTDSQFFDKVADSVAAWVENIPVDMDPEIRNAVIDDLISDIVDRHKYLQMNPDKKFSDEDEIENLRFQVFKRLDKVLEPGSGVTPSVLKIEELYKMINGDGYKKSLTAKQAQEFQTALNEEISNILNDYQICCDKRELLPRLANELYKLRNSGYDQDEIVENLMDTISRYTYLIGDPVEELAYKLLYRTKKLIAKIKGDVGVKRRDVKDAVMTDVGDFQGSSGAKRKMMEKDLGSPLEDSYGTMSGPGSESRKERYGMSFNGLSNFIDSWISSIPADDTKDEDEIMDMRKQRMYCLMHKIGEMNVDPEIFNDSSLYESVLREELQHLFGDVSANDEEFKALKEDLVEKVLEAQRRAHDELAGQSYKNSLRDNIGKLLPEQRNVSKDDQATIETLKDQLADAYIDLHYSGNNDNQRDKLKRKISNEINRFCKDYLNRNPCSSLNSQKLNRDLYAALNKVPLPTGDSIRYEVEQARIREEINDWVKELPLQPQYPTELLTRNKLIYVLSKKLFDLEVDDQEEDTDNELMRNKIVAFLNKLPLESDEDNETIANRLIDRLKASEVSRKYNASSNVTIDPSGKVSAANSSSGMKTPICPGRKQMFDKQKPSGFPKVCTRHAPKQFDGIPPCTLSPEDREHLERIRRRTCLSPNCVSSLLKRNKCPLDLGSSPVDTGSQTLFDINEQQKNLNRFSYEKVNIPWPRASANLPHQGKRLDMEKTQPSTLCPGAFDRTCSGPSRPQSCPMRRHVIPSSNVSHGTEEVQPQVLIKQFYWDPGTKNTIDSEMQHSGKSSRRQSDSMPCPSPRPCTPSRPTVCRPTPCPRPASGSSSRSPCHSSRPPRCQPPRPCETRATCPSFSGSCRRPSSGKLKQNTNPQPKLPRQDSSERYSYYDPLNTFSRSPCTPSPCMSPFGINCTPPGSPGFSKRVNENRMPKRDGLQDQIPSNSSRHLQKERVIELGSLDDVGSSRPKKRPNDQTDRPKFQEDDRFWSAPMRRVILDEGIDESLVMERERREGRVTCRCKEKLLPKIGRSQPGNVPNQTGSQSSEEGQNLTRCAKCCGIHCPYPSFLYFRQ